MGTQEMARQGREGSAPAQSRVTLAGFLADRDEGCPSCGYNLRGLGTDRCPECNSELVLRVAMAEPRLALFLSTVVAWALGAGFSVLLILYVLTRFAFTPSSLPPMREFLPVPVAGALIQGTAVVLLIVHQKRVRRRGRGARIGLLVAGVVCTLVNVGVFAWRVN